MGLEEKLKSITTGIELFKVKQEQPNPLHVVQAYIERLKQFLKEIFPIYSNANNDLSQELLEKIKTECSYLDFFNKLQEIKSFFEVAMSQAADGYNDLEMYLRIATLAAEIETKWRNVKSIIAYYPNNQASVDKNNNDNTISVATDFEQHVSNLNPIQKVLFKAVWDNNLPLLEILLSENEDSVFTIYDNQGFNLFDFAVLLKRKEITDYFTSIIETAENRDQELAWTKLHCYAACDELEKLQAEIENLTDISRSELYSLIASLSVIAGNHDSERVFKYLVHKVIEENPSSISEPIHLPNMEQGVSLNLAQCLFLLKKYDLAEYFLDCVKANSKSLSHLSLVNLCVDDAIIRQDPIVIQRLLNYIDKRNVEKVLLNRISSPFFMEQFLQFLKQTQDVTDIRIDLREFAKKIAISADAQTRKEIANHINDLSKILYISTKNPEEYIIQLLNEALLYEEAVLIEFAAVFFQKLELKNYKDIDSFIKIYTTDYNLLNYAIDIRNKEITQAFLQYAPSLVTVEDKKYGHPFFLVMSGSFEGEDSFCKEIFTQMLQVDLHNRLGVLKTHFEDLIIYAAIFKNEEALKLLLLYSKGRVRLDEKLYQFIANHFSDVLKQQKGLVVSARSRSGIAFIEDILSLNTGFSNLCDKDGFISKTIIEEMLITYRIKILTFMVFLNKYLYCRENFIDKYVLNDFDSKLKLIFESGHQVITLVNYCIRCDDSDYFEQYQKIYQIAATIEETWLDIKSKAATQDDSLVVMNGVYSIPKDIFGEIFSYVIASSDQPNVATIVEGFGRDNWKRGIFDDYKPLWKSACYAYVNTVEEKARIIPSNIHVGFKKVLLKKLDLKHQFQIKSPKFSELFKLIRANNIEELQKVLSIESKILEFFLENAVEHNGFIYSLAEIAVKLRRHKLLKLLAQTLSNQFDVLIRHQELSRRLPIYFIICGDLDNLKRCLSGISTLTYKQFMPLLMAAVKNGQNKISKYLIEEWFGKLQGKIITESAQNIVAPKHILITAYSLKQYHVVRYFLADLIPWMEKNSNPESDMYLCAQDMRESFLEYLFIKEDIKKTYEFIIELKLCSAERFLNFVMRNEVKQIEYLIDRIVLLAKCFDILDDKGSICAFLKELKAIFVKGVEEGKVNLIKFAVCYFNEVLKIYYVKQYLEEHNQLDDFFSNTWVEVSRRIIPHYQTHFRMPSKQNGAHILNVALLHQSKDVIMTILKYCPQMLAMSDSIFGSVFFHAAKICHIEYFEDIMKFDFNRKLGVFKNNYALFIEQALSESLSVDKIKLIIEGCTFCSINLSKYKNHSAVRSNPELLAAIERNVQAVTTNSNNANDDISDSISEIIEAEILSQAQQELIDKVVKNDWFSFSESDFQQLIEIINCYQQYKYLHETELDLRSIISKLKNYVTVNHQKNINIFIKYSDSIFKKFKLKLGHFEEKKADGDFLDLIRDALILINNDPSLLQFLAILFDQIKQTDQFHEIKLFRSSVNFGEFLFKISFDLQHFITGIPIINSVVDRIHPFISTLNYLLIKNYEQTISQVIDYVPDLVTVEDENYGYPLFLALELYFYRKDFTKRISSELIIKLFEADFFSKNSFIKSNPSAILLYVRSFNDTKLTQLVINFYVKHNIPTSIDEEIDFDRVIHSGFKDILTANKTYIMEHQKDCFRAVSKYKNNLTHFMGAIESVLVAIEKNFSIQKYNEIKEHYYAIQKSYLELISFYHSKEAFMTDVSPVKYFKVLEFASNIEFHFKRFQKTVVEVVTGRKIIYPDMTIGEYTIPINTWCDIFSRVIPQSKPADIVTAFGRRNVAVFNNESLWQVAWQSYQYHKKDHDFDKPDDLRFSVKLIIETGFKQVLLEYLNAADSKSMPALDSRDKFEYRFLPNLYAAVLKEDIKALSELLEGKINLLLDYDLAFKIGYYDFSLLELAVYKRKHHVVAFFMDLIESDKENTFSDRQLVKCYASIGDIAKLSQLIFKLKDNIQDDFSFVDLLHDVAILGQHKVIEFLFHHCAKKIIEEASTGKDKIRYFLGSAYEHKQMHVVRYFIDNLFEKMIQQKELKPHIMFAIRNFINIFVERSSNDEILTFIFQQRKSMNRQIVFMLITAILLCGRFNFCKTVMQSAHIKGMLWADSFLTSLSIVADDSYRAKGILQDIDFILKYAPFPFNNSELMDKAFNQLRCLYVYAVAKNDSILFKFVHDYFSRISSIPRVESYLIANNQLRDFFSQIFVNLNAVKKDVHISDIRVSSVLDAESQTQLLNYKLSVYRAVIDYLGSKFSNSSIDKNSKGFIVNLLKKNPQLLLINDLSFGSPLAYAVTVCSKELLADILNIDCDFNIGALKRDYELVIESCLKLKEETLIESLQTIINSCNEQGIDLQHLAEKILSFIKDDDKREIVASFLEENKKCTVNFNFN